MQVQTIVDHHHASDQKQATKVRFSEPGDEKYDDDDDKVCDNMKIGPLNPHIQLYSFVNCGYCANCCFVFAIFILCKAG